MGCPGCGGKGKSPGGTFGHILGCGEPTSPSVPDKPPGRHWNAFGMPEQRGILRRAMRASGLNPSAADKFATELRVLLEEHSAKCADSNPGQCMHCA